MKNIITNAVIIILIVMNICVGLMIHEGLKPKCFVEGCNYARIEKSHYCSRHLDYEMHDKDDIWQKVKNKN